MRVLIFGMNYTPELTGVGPFTTSLAEHLVSKGHAVTVVTSFPHYPQWAVQPPYLGRWRTVETISGVKVRRSRIVLPRRVGLASRVLYDSSLVAGSVMNIVGIRRPEIVLNVSPPVQIAVAAGLLARRWHAPSISIIEDLPLEAALGVGLMKKGRLFELGRQLERVAYRLADQIVVISQGFRESLEKSGVSSEKIHLIPHWAHVDWAALYAPEPSVRRFLDAGEEELLVVYAGNMGTKQGLTTALSAASLGSPDSLFRLALVGDGSDRALLQDRIAQEKISNAALRPLQPEAFLHRILAAADLLLLSQRADITSSVAPSKLLTYMAAARPVLAAVHEKSEAAILVRESGCGIVIPPENPQALVEAIRVLKQDASRREEMGRSGRAFAEAHFHRQSVMAQWDSLLHKTLHAHRTALASGRASRAGLRL